MITSIKRLQLQRRGLATTRRRRKQEDNDVLHAMRYSPLVRLFILLVFFLGIVALIRLAVPNDPVFGQDTLKASLVAAFILFAAFVQYFANHPTSFGQNGRTALMFGAIFVQLCAIQIAGSIVNNVDYIVTNRLQDSFLFMLIPYALAPMALSILMGRRQAIFGAIFSSLFACLLVPGNMLFEFLIASLICGMVGIYATHELRKRSRLMRAGCYVGLIHLLLALGLGRISLIEIFNPAEMEWRLVGIQIVTVFLSGVITAGIVGGFLPMLESMFGLTTNITWLELSDLNHKLLKRMTIECPGTYHHSLVVARLSEAAAEKIGANPIQCQVCSYFHDIGKLLKPGYYIENLNSADNPHDDLSPNMSALVVISHVKEGVDLAIKHKLKQPIIDVIQEHHGTSLTYYFYRRALDKQEEIRKLVQAGKAHEEDIPEVKEDGFRYPGPLPRTQESAIISLADAVESASRCLEKPTPNKIEQLIDEIVDARLRDGQLDESDITLRELHLIKQSFTSTLNSMMHSRVAYPKEGKEDSRSGHTTLSAGQRSKAATKRLSTIDAA